MKNKILKNLTIAALIWSASTKSVNPWILNSVVMNDLNAKIEEFSRPQDYTDYEIRHIGKEYVQNKWDKLLNDNHIKGAFVVLHNENVNPYHLEYGTRWIARIHDQKTYDPLNPSESDRCAADIYLFIVYAINKLLSQPEKDLLKAYHDKPTSEWPQILQEKLGGVIDIIDICIHECKRDLALKHMIDNGNIA